MHAAALLRLQKQIASIAFLASASTLLNNSFLIRNSILLIWLREESLAIQGQKFNLVKSASSNLFENPKWLKP